MGRDQRPLEVLRLGGRHLLRDRGPQPDDHPVLPRGSFLVVPRGGALGASIRKRFTKADCGGGFAPSPLPAPAPVVRYEYYPGSPPAKGGLSRPMLIFIFVVFAVLLAVVLVSVLHLAAKKTPAGGPASSPAAGQTA